MRQNYYTFTLCTVAEDVKSAQIILLYCEVSRLGVGSKKRGGSSQLDTA